MAKKKKNDILVPLAVGAGALLLFSSSKPEGAVPKYKPQEFKGSIVDMFGFSKAVDKVTAVIRSWDVNKVSKKTAIDAAKKAVAWARMSANLLEGMGDYSYGIPSTVFYMYASEFHKKATETEGYLAGQPSVERYKTALMNLLVFTKPGIATFETLMGIFETFAGPAFGVAMLLDELYKIAVGLKKFVGGVFDFMQYLPYIALGIAGWWGYQNFIKDEPEVRRKA